MSNTVINAKIVDQKIQLTNIPLIASGSQGVLQIKCTFDDLWAGYQTTAVFFREEKGKVADVFHVPVYLDLADVPHEVLKKEGVFFLSFMGVSENTRTTVAVPLEVKRGAITEGTSVPDPTPDVYTQLLEILNKSGIIPDSTLTQAGKAADAKATGEAINKVSEYTTQMVNDAKDQLTTDLQAADRPIECGIDGDLTWEKWASGKAVCWGTSFLGDVAATKSWGTWYESPEYTIDFPAGLFATTPKIIDITVKDADSALFVARYGGDATAENTGKFTLSRPLSRNVLNVTVGLIAIGVWKVDEPVVEEADE